jgi:hypothetical protein
VQKPEEHQWFPGRDCTGDAKAFRRLGKDPAEIEPHLRHTGDAHGFMDLLRTLGFGVELADSGYVRPPAKPWRQFRIAAA